MARLFGTDGVRGVAGQDLTSQLALDVSRAAATVLHDSGAFEAKESAGGRWPWWGAIRGLPVSFWRPPWWPGWLGPGWTCSGWA